MTPKPLELLSPARNLEYGKAAILHGADAVYMGAPKFGARQAAGNSLKDIAKLVNFAKLFKTKVYVTINTLLFDHEILQAESLIWELYHIGVEAIIIQDMGILELNLPPIAIHASTQTHNTSIEKVQFLEKAGFERVILARELSIAEIEAISKHTHVELEAFVHGALCVCYSGQCYMSQYIAGKSGNRGECVQPCRSFYDLYSEEELLLKDVHLLSLKDFNASEQLLELCEAGIMSFKIEGRLKDLSYLKNVTAHYRQLLDRIIEQFPEKYKRASSGTTKILFEPNVYKTFNRGYSRYFLEDRKSELASFFTQKSIGERVGEVTSVGKNFFCLDSEKVVTPGDGFCFFDSNKKLCGFSVNKVDNGKVYLNSEVDLAKGTILYRNNDTAFEKKLQSQSAERKIAVSFSLNEVSTGFSLKASDEDGFEAEWFIEAEKQPAKNPKQANESIQKQLAKLGDTIFVMKNLEIHLSQNYFISISVLNELRRNTLQKLTDIRLKHKEVKMLSQPDYSCPYPTQTLDYRGNILNQKAAEFYKKHGVEKFEKGFELQSETKGKVLMQTKYCLLYEIGQCRKNSTTEEKFQKPLFIKNNQNIFALEFDCKNCCMKILATK